jgi:beta-glucosidase
MKGQKKAVHEPMKVKRPSRLGHGLGYGTCSYGDPELVDGDARLVQVKVANTGRQRSREVVQLDPGEAAVVTVAAAVRMWRCWDSAAQAWGLLPESGRLLVARGLGDIRGTIGLGPSG